MTLSKSLADHALFEWVYAQEIKFLTKVQRARLQLLDVPQDHKVLALEQISMDHLQLNNQAHDGIQPVFQRRREPRALGVQLNHKVRNVQAHWLNPLA